MIAEREEGYHVVHQRWSEDQQGHQGALVDDCQSPPTTGTRRYQELLSEVRRHHQLWNKRELGARSKTDCAGRDVQPEAITDLRFLSDTAGIASRSRLLVKFNLRLAKSRNDNRTIVHSSADQNFKYRCMISRSVFV
jgi:hypothetical protein